MNEIITIEDIRNKYHELLADTEDCLSRNDIRKGFAVWTQINKLLGIIIPMRGSREILNLKVNLRAMGNKLVYLSNIPRFD